MNSSQIVRKSKASKKPNARQYDKNDNGVDDRLDFVVKICAVILPFTTLPQLQIIFINKQADGVSALTWFLYGILTIPLFIYSIKRKETPYIILNGLWIVVDFLVAAGAIIYA